MALLGRAPVPGILQPEGARGIVHIPAMIWGVAKIGALLGAVATKKHVAVGVAKKFVQTVGVRRSIQIIGEVNNTMLRSGTHSPAAHGMIAASLQELEVNVVALGQSGAVRALETWLLDLEKKSPALLVAVGKTYLNTLGPVKAAQTVIKGVDRGEEVVRQAEEAAAAAVATVPDAVAGLSQEQWDRRIRAAFPELQGHRVLLLRTAPAASGPPTAASEAGNARAEEGLDRGRAAAVRAPE